MHLLPRLHPPDEELVALLDDNLPLPERVALERHLTACDRCRDLRERMDRALLALAAEIAVDPVESLDDLPRWRVRPAVPVGMLFGALLVAGWMRHQQRRADPRMQGAA